MRLITYTLAGIVAVAAPLAIAQVSGVDTTRSLEDHASFPDPTLPQADKYIPEVRKKVTNPLPIDEETEAEDESPSAEEVADFIGLEVKPVAPSDDVDAGQADTLENAAAATVQ